MAGLSNVMLQGKLGMSSLTAYKTTPKANSVRKTMQKAQDARAQANKEKQAEAHLNRSESAKQAKAERLAIAKEQAIANNDMQKLFAPEATPMVSNAYANDYEDEEVETG